ncbi:MAG: histidine--tRNA ligase [Actinobacteria bacterium]|nr:MAG: histidine--tRNA ligase [Actinomycetota bacterium]
MPPFRTPKGTHDVLPPESGRWQALVAAFAARADRAGYGLVVSPTFEEVGVFQRLGESTDVVRKEMYEFEDRDARHMALRPEGTAPVVRAYAQHRPPLPFKAWYVAPSFRYERPQAGRYREHHQLGVEVLGTDDPDVDVEVIALAARLFAADLGLKRVTLRLNSLGDAECRPAYREVLVAYLTAHRAELCDEHRDRIDVNPLRVLDCKRPGCARVTKDAPRMLDYLCDACRAHFQRVEAGLAALGVAYTIDTLLVRGLDYYMRTTFEFAADALDAAQNGIGGGGRYDGLAEALGAPPTPGIGFGLGVERILLACDAEGVFPAPAARVDVFVVDTAGGATALELTHALRDAGIRADRAFDARSMKAQFKQADRSGAELVVIAGPDEVADGQVKVQSLTSAGEELVAIDDVVAHVTKRLDR